MEKKRFRQLVGLAVAGTILLLAFAGWSQLRLRAVRAEIDALASETALLASMNERLHRQVEAQASLRDRLRAEGAPVLLQGENAGEAAATIYLDEAARRALLVIEALRVDASCAYQLRIVPSDGPDLLVTFGVDPEGDVELLLDDLPAGVEAVQIESGGTADVLLSGSR